MQNTGNNIRYHRSVATFCSVVSSPECTSWPMEHQRVLHGATTSMRSPTHTRNLAASTFLVVQIDAYDSGVLPVDICISDRDGPGRRETGGVWHSICSQQDLEDCIQEWKAWGLEGPFPDHSAMDLHDKRRYCPPRAVRHISELEHNGAYYLQLPGAESWVRALAFWKCLNAQSCWNAVLLCTPHYAVSCFGLVAT